MTFVEGPSIMGAMTAKSKAVTRTATWINGIDEEIHGAYEFNPETEEFDFRIIGSEGLTIPAEPVIINNPTFRWDAPVVIVTE